MNRASLYVYYRIVPEHLEETRTAVDALFAAVAKAYGVHGRWMRRRDDPHTYLEVYVDIENVDALLAFTLRECERMGFARFLADSGARHNELFVDVD